MKWSRTGASCTIARTTGRLTCLPQLHIPHGIATTLLSRIKHSPQSLVSKRQSGPRLQSTTSTWSMPPSLKHSLVHWVPQCKKTGLRTLMTLHRAHPLRSSRACSKLVARVDPGLGQGKSLGRTLCKCKSVVQSEIISNPSVLGGCLQHSKRDSVFHARHCANFHIYHTPHQ